MRRLFYSAVFVFILSATPLLAAIDSGKNSEPSIAEVQREALRYAGFNPHDFDQMEHKAKWAAALPRLQFGYERDLQEVAKLQTNDSVSISGGEVIVGPQESNLDENLQAGTKLDVTVTWYLDRLAFNQDVLDIRQEKFRWQREMQNLLEDVSQIYFKRQALLSQRRHGSRRGFEAEQRQIQIDHLTSRLDALTGGWFSQKTEVSL